MNTIDKVLLEWSVKTDKGYPDVNSKEDMDLFESMFGFRLVKEVLAEEYNYAGNCVTGLDDPYFQRNVCYDATEMAGIVDEFSNEIIQADEFVKKVNWPSDQLGPAEDTIYDFAYNKYKDIYWAYHIDDDVHFFFVKDVINEVKNPNSYITVRDITEEGKKTIGVFGSGFRLNEEEEEVGSTLSTKIRKKIQVLTKKHIDKTTKTVLETINTLPTETQQKIEKEIDKHSIESFKSNIKYLSELFAPFFYITVEGAGRGELLPLLTIQNSKSGGTADKDIIVGDSITIEVKEIDSGGKFKTGKSGSIRDSDLDANMQTLIKIIRNLDNIPEIKEERDDILEYYDKTYKFGSGKPSFFLISIYGIVKKLQELNLQSQDYLKYKNKRYSYIVNQDGSIKLGNEVDSQKASIAKLKKHDYFKNPKSILTDLYKLKDNYLKSVNYLLLYKDKTPYPAVFLDREDAKKFIHPYDINQQAIRLSYGRENLTI